MHSLDPSGRAQRPPRVRPVDCVCARRDVRAIRTTVIGQVQRQQRRQTKQRDHPHAQINRPLIRLDWSGIRSVHVCNTVAECVHTGNATKSSDHVTVGDGGRGFGHCPCGSLVRDSNPIGTEMSQRRVRSDLTPAPRLDILGLPTNHSKTKNDAHTKRKTLDGASTICCGLRVACSLPVGRSFNMQRHYTFEYLLVSYAPMWRCMCSLFIQYSGYLNVSYLYFFRTK